MHLFREEFSLPIDHLLRKGCWLSICIKEVPFEAVSRGVEVMGLRILTHGVNDWLELVSVALVAVHEEEYHWNRSCGCLSFVECFEGILASVDAVHVIDRVSVTFARQS